MSFHFDLIRVAWSIVYLLRNGPGSDLKCIEGFKSWYIPSLDKSCIYPNTLINTLTHFSIKTEVVGAHLKSIIEVLLM